MTTATVSDELTFGEAMNFLKVSATVLHRLVETGAAPCKRTIMSFGKSSRMSTTKHRFSRKELLAAVEGGRLANIHVNKKLRTKRNPS